MRVGLDLQLARGTATGIGEYAQGLFAALRALGADVIALRTEGFDPWRFDRRVVWDQALLPLAAARARVDVIHCASGTMPLCASAPIVCTVHDVAWSHVQAHARAYARTYFGAFSLSRYRRAKRILVDSHFSRSALLEVAPKLDSTLIDVAYPGVAADVAGIVRARDDGTPFGLVVGTLEQRKNFEVLVRALPRVPGLRLVSVGPPTPYRETCARLARELGVSDRIDIRGYVPRNEILDLYARATFAAAPSRYEGFGYAGAQALCAGVPLISSDAASLPEVAGPDAPLLPPDDVDAWAAAMRDLLERREAAELRASAARAASIARFAWRRCAEITARAYAAALVRG